MEVQVRKTVPHTLSSAFCYHWYEAAHAVSQNGSVCLIPRPSVSCMQPDHLSMETTWGPRTRPHAPLSVGLHLLSCVFSCLQNVMIEKHALELTVSVIILLVLTVFV